MKISPEYISLVKNIGAIIYGVGEGTELKNLEWLANQFEQRILGITPSLWGSFEERGKIRYLDYPFTKFDETISSLSEKTDIETKSIEVIAFASAFACPIILLSRLASENFSKISQFIFKAEPPNKRNLKRILSICVNAGTDIHAWSQKSAQIYFRGKKSWNDSILERRKLSKDYSQKRFWRFGNGRGTWPIFFYLDLLMLAKDSKDFHDIPIWSLVPACIIYPI